MAFMIFEKAILNGSPVLRDTGKTFKLAGYNLLYRAWEKRGKPTNQGWKVTSDELIRLHFSREASNDDIRLIIDWNPENKSIVGLIELSEIYAFTCGNGGTGWTPLMLKLLDLPEQEYKGPEQRAEIMNAMPYDSVGPDFVEFLYLKGDKDGWNWGVNGNTNAAFIQGDARSYFQQFF